MANYYTTIKAVNHEILKHLVRVGTAGIDIDRLIVGLTYDFAISPQYIRKRLALLEKIGFVIIQDGKAYLTKKLNDDETTRPGIDSTTEQ